MGKSKKPSKAEPIKKCTCDHPFKCDCGNRPERPSKGHKWDPTTQTWGGKGHKQKGASIQAASTGQAQQITQVGGVAIKQWQKLPSDLLRELTKRHGMGNPQYRRLDKQKNNNEYRYQLIVPPSDKNNKPNNSDHNVVLSPSLAVSNEEQAKEEAALLGLLYVFPKLPHERTLPEPYRSTFLEALKNTKNTAVGAAAAAAANGGAASNAKNRPASNDAKNTTKNQPSNNNAKSDTKAVESTTSNSAKANTNLIANLPSFHITHGGRNHNSSNQPSAGPTPLLTKAQIKQAKLQHQRQIQSRIRQHEAIRNANKPMEVFMCASIRRRVERLLAGDRNDNVDVDSGDFIDLEDEKEDLINDGEEEDVLQSYVVTRLVREGFTTSQVRRGYRAVVMSNKIQSSDNDGSGAIISDQEMDKAYEETLQHLCIHLSEDQLPIGFDPRGGTLDVIRPVSKSAAASSGGRNEKKDRNLAATESYEPRVVQFADQFGLTNQEAFAVLSMEEPAEETSSESVQKFKLWNAICSAVSLPKERCCFADGASSAISEDSIANNKEIASNELEALEAIFDGQDFTIAKIGNGTTSVSIGLPFGDSKLFLEVIYSKGYYPDLLPMVFLRSDGSSKFREGGRLHVKMAQFLSTLEPGQEVIFELFGHVQELLQDICDGQSSCVDDASLLLSSLNLGGSPDVSSSNGKVRAPSNEDKAKPAATKQIPKPSRRPREKSSFWNTPPKNTPSADAFPKLSSLLEKARKSLPAAEARSEFLRLMDKAGRGGRVMLVTGETGCGKTTQIPQFILENNPAGAKIVVAQPRRLAATGVAARVAIERGESQAGIGSVGYSVRGDSKSCASTRLMFCTTGVLLRQLQSQDALENISHCIIDEVHERHLDSDVLLAILKRVLPENPHLNVVLMSATMDADRFAGYWGTDTPRMHIPGFTHPVQDFMLEDVLKLTGHAPPRKKGGKKSETGNYQIQPSFVDGDEVDPDGDEPDQSQPEEHPASSTSAPISLEERIKRMDVNVIDYDLLALLIQTVLQTKTDDGSILVFLPGVGEIERAERIINRKHSMNSIQVLPLHGGLQAEKQLQVFIPAPKGVTKIILSTNVAETSITIPDCTMVIDTCKEKQSSFDPDNRMPLLLEVFASQDSLRQRRGRAGRVRPGVCYKLISKEHHSNLPAHGTPEIKRSAIEQTLLSLLFLGLENGSGDFLRSMIDPPSKQSIESALKCLEQLGAIERKGVHATLCPLGRHLSGIPAPPTVAKLLVMGSLLGCRSISLAIAAGLSVGRSPFIRLSSSPFQRRDTNNPEQEEQAANDQILEARRALFKSVGNSEHCMLGKAYLLWDEAKGAERRKFCDRLGLAFNSMKEMKQLVQQLNASLSSLGFLDDGNSDTNANSWRIVRSVVVSALAPAQVIRVQRPTQKYTETVEGAVEKDGKAQDFKFFICSGDRNDERKEERVFIHPASSMFSVGTFSCPWLVYHRMMRTSKAYIHDATEASAYALLLFGGKMDVQASKGLVVLDNRIELSANARIGSLMGGLRKKIDLLLDSKVVNPSVEISGTNEMKLVVDLLRFDGLGRS